MDLDTLKIYITTATDYQVNKRILREKIQTDLHFTYNGRLYLEDTYQNPIHIPDPEFFAEQCRECYAKVMNRWHQQHDELRKLRKIHFNV